MIYDPNGHYTVGVLDQSGAFAITDHGAIGGLYTSIARAGQHLILMNRTGRAQTGSINASGKFVASPPFEAWPYQYVAGTDG